MSWISQLYVVDTMDVMLISLMVVGLYTMNIPLFIAGCAGTMLKEIAEWRNEKRKAEKRKEYERYVEYKNKPGDDDVA